MRSLIKIIKSSFMPFIIIIVSFLSYNSNFFGAANSSWFHIHDLYSQQTVLDGILYGLDTDKSNRDDGFKLGFYSRPGVADITSDPRKLLSYDLYKKENRLGEFSEYKSQYGLQVRLFGLIAKLGYGDIRILQGLSAISMSLVIGILFWLVRRDFSPASAVLFSLALIFSPWIIVFARNLYWVPVTWFLPLTISMYFSDRIFNSSTSMIIMLVSLFLGFLIKFLCGYEYMTTIFIASFVPILYQALNSKISFKKIFITFITLFLVFIISFVTALGIHLKSGFEDISSGINFVSSRAEIHTASHSYTRLSVLSRYLTTFYDFIPWLPSVRDLSVIDNDKDMKILEDVYLNPSLEGLQDSLFKTSSYLKLALVSVIVSCLSFLILLGFMCRIWLKVNFPLKAVIAVSFIAPVSWFFLAKGHSFVHYQLNYVLWYLPFIPYSLAILVEHFINRRNRRLKNL